MERNSFVSDSLVPGRESNVEMVATVEDQGKVKDQRPSGPRSEAREQAILDAAIELLKDVGYDRFSMDALAERAKAGKATIYRHWSGKAQIVVEAVRRMKCDQVEVHVDTGSLRGDLLSEIDQACVSLTTEDGAIICGVISAMRTDTELADLVRIEILDSKRGKFDDIVERAIRRGELPEGSTAGIVEEVMPAMLMNRLVIQGEPLDAAFAAHVVDNIVLPLLHP